MKPTPTQEENDLAASGVHVIDKEPDGSPPDPGITPAAAPGGTSTRQIESQAGEPRQLSDARDHANAIGIMTETAVAKPRIRVKATSVPATLVTKAEGEAHAGPWLLPVTGGWLPADVGDSINWWQNGYNVQGTSTQSAMVEACVSAYAQTVAMLPGDHWRMTDKGGRDRVKTSSLSRLLRHPNDYQSISDFMLNATRSLYLEGNVYALGLRNARFEIDELHLMDPLLSYPRLASNGEIFYQLYGNQVVRTARPRGADRAAARRAAHPFAHGAPSLSNAAGRREPDRRGL